MVGSLTRSQDEHGAVDVGHGQFAFREELPELLDGRLLNVRDEPEPPREALELADLRAILLQACLGFQRALLDLDAEGGQDHS